MSSKKVVHISTIHRPTDNRIFHKECTTLSEHGYDVTFIVTHTRDETVSNIRIRSIPVAASGLAKLTTSAGHAFRIIREFDRDATLHFHDPELLPLAILTKITGFRVVYDAHEDTPRQIFHLHWIPRWLKPAVALGAFLTEKIGGWLFDGIVAANETISRRFPDHKTVVVRNYPRIDRTSTPLDDYAQRLSDVVYAGGLTAARGIKEMVKAIGIVNQSRPARLILAGSFHPAGLQDVISQLPEWRFVHYLGWLSRDGVESQLQKCRVGLVTLRPEKQYLHAMPTKLFEYAAGGLPIVASNLPATKSFIVETGCGLVVDPEPNEIAAAITYLLDNPREAEQMGRRGREAVVQRYNWSSEGAELLQLYSDVLGEKPDALTASTA